MHSSSNRLILCGIGILITVLLAVCVVFGVLLQYLLPPYGVLILITLVPVVVLLCKEMDHGC